MVDMLEALKKAGVVSESKYQVERKTRLEKYFSETGWNRNKLTSKSRRPTNLDRLQLCGNVAEFKDLAKKLIIEFPDLMNEVVSAVHLFKGKDGGKRLIWLVLQVRDKLPKIKAKHKAQFINRVFRKSGGTIEFPIDWLE